MESSVNSISKGLVKTTQRLAEAHHYYVVDEIGNAKDYLDLIHTLRNCDQNDQVFIHLNTPGGHMFTAIQIVHAMSECRGSVITCADGEIASAGSLIFFAGNGMIVGDFCSGLIHDGRSRESGTMADMDKSSAHYRGVYRNLCEKIYGPFVSKKELDFVLDGGSLYMDAESIRARVDKATRKMEKQANEGRSRTS